MAGVMVCRSKRKFFLQPRAVERRQADDEGLGEILAHPVFQLQAVFAVGRQPVRQGVSSSYLPRLSGQTAMEEISTSSFGAILRRFSRAARMTARSASGSALARNMAAGTPA